MKKCLGFAFCLWIMFSVPAVAASCAGGSGTVLTGVDGTSYCKSNITMNWWSAFAWCDAIGGRLIDVTTECIKTTGTSGCPNLTPRVRSAAASTSTASTIVTPIAPPSASDSELL